MNVYSRATLRSRSTTGWLFQPTGEVNEAGREFLLSQLLGSPFAVLMGSFNALIVASVALVKSGRTVFALFVALELALAAGRLIEWRRRTARVRNNPGYVPTVDASVALSVSWCALQGMLAFTVISSGDLVLSVISGMFAMALSGPICARNYPAPRFAFLLVLLIMMPFVAGALASREWWLITLVPMTPPFLVGAMTIILTFHRAMLLTMSAQARMRHLAEHDCLTGILNRQGMDRELSLISPVVDRQMALLSIDLDGFKLVNDQHGHGAGDMLLILVAERMQGVIRSEDLLARMGGDEFMIVVRGMTPDQIGPLADRLIDAISCEPYDVGSCSPVRVGASVGFACLPEDAATTVELRVRADGALYAAKGAGKGVGRRFGSPVRAAACDYEVDQWPAGGDRDMKEPA